MPRYLLTAEAKEAAKRLVDAWDERRISQKFDITAVYGDGRIMHVYVSSDSGHLEFTPPELSLLEELGHFDLLRIARIRNNRWEILLLQTLRDAVKNDFKHIPDIPTSVVGTIIYGSLEMGDGAVFGSSVYGDVTVTLQTLPDELIKLLGTDSSRPQIASVIEELKTLPESADKSARLEKAGKVIEELGRSLAHLSNTGGALAAIALIARMLSGGGL